MSRWVVTLREMRPSEARPGIPWRVVAVFDPDGGGGDFAYTVGLFNVGLPEVHVWGRPTDGTDPGEDFSLSTSDRNRLLNKVARQLINGDLNAGDDFVEELDGGLSAAHYHLDAPVPAAALEAYQTHLDAQVIGLRWELHRPLVGIAASVDAAVCDRIVDLTSALRATLPRDDTWIATPGPAENPWAEALDALRETVTAAPAARLDVIAPILLEVSTVWPWLMGSAATAARPLGRLDAHAAAMRFAHDDARTLAKTHMLAKITEANDGALRDAVTSFWAHVLGALYGGLVVSDGLPDEQATLHEALLEALVLPARACARLARSDGAAKVLAAYEALIATDGYDPDLDPDGKDEDERGGDEGEVSIAEELGINGRAVLARLGCAAHLYTGALSVAHARATGDAACAAALLDAGLISAGDANAASSPGRRLLRLETLTQHPDAPDSGGGH